MFPQRWTDLDSVAWRRNHSRRDWAGITEFDTIPDLVTPERVFFGNWVIHSGVRIGKDSGPI